MWVLIVVSFVTGSQIRVDNVSGFTSQRACEVAKEFVVRSTETLARKGISNAECKAQ